MLWITEGLEQVVKELGLYPKKNENQHSVGRLVRMTKLLEVPREITLVAV